MGNSHDKVLKGAKYIAPKSVLSISYALAGIGLLTFVVGAINGNQRIWSSYLVALFYFSCLGLGGMFFAAINHIAKAGWSVSVRRYSEAMTSFIPVMLVGSLILIVGLKYLYPWADSARVAQDPLLQAKTAYLNNNFMIIRMFIFGIGCLIFRYLIVGNSLKQDVSGDENLTHKNVGLSVGFMPFFAIAFSLFCVDLIMSLAPYWFSTIFGIYCFAGLIQSTFAVMALILIAFKKAGAVKGYVNEEHLHDVSKFMKGFTVFWAYIAFSQFMLIWYANLPEETEYYIMRSQNGWLAVSMALLICRFIVPFLALLPRGLKRNENHVILVSLLILVMQYVDIYWMVYPNFNGGHIVFGLWEIGIFGGFLGIFMIGLLGFFRRNNVVAIRDPRMHEAINHHVTY